MKYKIYWLEYHNPINWGDGDYETGILNLKDTLPTIAVRPDPNEDDGWVECECEDTFEAENIEEAKKIASEYECGNSEVFSVFDKQGKHIFTEEDLT